VQDVTDQATFNHVPQWLEEIERSARENVSKILIGNKSDITSRRVVEQSAGKVQSKTERISQLGSNLQTKLEFLSWKRLQRILPMSPRLSFRWQQISKEGGFYIRLCFYSLLEWMNLPHQHRLEPNKKQSLLDNRSKNRRLGAVNKVQARCTELQIFSSKYIHQKSERVEVLSKRTTPTRLFQSCEKLPFVEQISVLK
jgi:GTPase SAR1 family protein